MRARVRGLQNHHREYEKPDVLNPVYPGIGIDWAEISSGSSSTFVAYFAVYAMEWEAVAARWAQDDNELLQPASPCWAMPVWYLFFLMRQKVAKKELELCATHALFLCPHLMISLL